VRISISVSSRTDIRKRQRLDIAGQDRWSGKIGWWEGWVEWPTGPMFFALNIDTPNRTRDLAKRQDIARSILRSLKALPDT
jgi:beta-lactamase class D